MNAANDVKIQCPMCYRLAFPQLRAVASGLLAVCPYCLSPHPRERRGQCSLRDSPDGALATDARIRDARRPKPPAEE
jgi:hypothetical protein